MADESRRNALDAIIRQLHDEVEAQLADVASRHSDELEAARRAVEAETEQRWSAKVDEVRTEWSARLESEVAAARAEAERRMVAESIRMRVEAEQLAAEAAVRARHELEQAVEHAHARAAEQLSTERQQLSSERDRFQQELDDLRARLAQVEHERDEASAARTQAESTLEEERRARHEEALRLEQGKEQTEAVAAAARVAERQSQLALVERLLAGIRSLDGARSLTQVLSALLSAVANEAPRAALFIMTGPELKTWKAEGFGGHEVSPVSTSEEGLLTEVLRRGEPVATSDTGPAAPAFANLPHDRAAIAVPLLVGAQPVAILYADDANDWPAQAPASWPEAIQILCRHASVNLAHLTAARAADAMRRSAAAPGRSPAQPNQAIPADDSNSARRYAHLLVSEIKLYNEPAVRVGRQNRDLLTRLKPEIDRARRLYEERISSSVDSRAAFFQQELVQTLADGDPALLGGSA